MGWRGSGTLVDEDELKYRTLGERAQLERRLAARMAAEERRFGANASAVASCAELLQKHGTFARRRHNEEANTTCESATLLRELQEQLRPKGRKVVVPEVKTETAAQLKKSLGNEFYFAGLFKQGSRRDPQLDFAESCETVEVDDIPDNPMLADNLMLEYGSRVSPSAAKASGDHMKDSASDVSTTDAAENETIPTSSQDERAPAAILGTRRRRQAPPAQQTMALLLFRNADRAHPGEPLFVGHWPPLSLAELLRLASEVCCPLVGPAEALFTADLRRIKSLEEIRPGSAYILKGQENLDPPPFVHVHQTPRVASLRALTKDKRARSTPQLKDIREVEPAALREAAPMLRPPSAPPCKAKALKDLDLGSRRGSWSKTWPLPQSRAPPMPPVRAYATVRSGPL
eukprot:CAMPEP_0195069216 /NCGR_PEP_ID=MMETSP0448-20130528/13572_1 /TAXON_ID=66468 /ORGANISM="Heterocapsa triquestra, Strain CCMP 448" /LENGTH=401 /DNA_ID=CAMNT_0040100779 /DNA_START=140 /DNA_END=1345 /DNA_ORIENTATION=+